MGLTGPEGILSSTSLSASGTRSPHPLRGDKERERERERESHSTGSSFFSGSGSKNSFSGTPCHAMHCSAIPCPALSCTVLPYPFLLCTVLLCSQHTHHPTYISMSSRIAILISIESDDNEFYNQYGSRAMSTNIYFSSNNYSHLRYTSACFAYIGGSEEPCDGSLECCLDFHETASYPAAQRNMLANSSMQQVGDQTMHDVSAVKYNTVQYHTKQDNTIQRHTLPFLTCTIDTYVLSHLPSLQGMAIRWLGDPPTVVSTSPSPHPRATPLNRNPAVLPSSAGT